MDSALVLKGQSLVDISIQEYGTPLGLMAIAMENELSTTDELQPGQELKIPVLNEEDGDVAAYYAQKSIWPSTDVSDADLGNLEDNDPCNLCKCFT